MQAIGTFNRERDNMDTIQIKHKTTGAVIFEHICEGNNIAVTLKASIIQRANLVGANLEGANLEGTNLEGTNLYRANLYGANLYRANLAWTNLVGADLEGANLEGTNLEGTNLYRANLEGANLVGANLVGADLVGVNLVGAIGVVSFGPVGNENRICYAYVNNGIQFRIGCFNGDHNQAIEAIREKYGEFSNYEMMVRSAAWTLACKQIEKE